jgi:hypothetical protein
MNIDYKDFFKVNSKNLLMLVVILIIFIILAYASNKTSLQTKNCTKITKAFPTTATYNISTMGTTIDTTKLSQLFIKTAYNCCCSGKFKNDYVDICALQNCANYGVRALDFQVYKLNSKPIISASTVNEIQYKEIYNYLDFNDTMLQVNKMFITTPSNNSTEPLFLIFRVYSKVKDTYDQMFTSLNSIFGSTNGSKNIIFITSDLPNTTFVQVKGKVIILVEYSCIATTNEPECKTAFESSSLYQMSALHLNGSNNKVYRESELIDGKISINDYAEWFKTNANYLNIIYPNVQTSSSNYDFITSGFNNGISFIGLNFQTNDPYLTLLNTADSSDIPPIINGFGGAAFKLKPEKVAANDSTNELIIQFKANIDAGNAIINNMVKDNRVYTS